MYTVIIMNDEVKKRYHNYRYLFDAFLKNDQFSICEWNESGNDAEKSVPELFRAIEERTEWRAIILVDHSTSENSCKIDTNNPFDFKVNANKNGKEIEESSVDLIRLTHFLGGFPEPGIKRFVDRYNINVLGKEISVSFKFYEVFKDIVNRFDTFKETLGDFYAGDDGGKRKETDRGKREKSDLDMILCQTLIDYLTVLLGEIEKDELDKDVVLFKTPSFFDVDGNHIVSVHFEKRDDDKYEEKNSILKKSELTLFKNDRIHLTQKQKDEIVESIRYFSEHQSKLRNAEECDAIDMDMLLPTPKNEPEEFSDEELEKYETIISNRNYEFLPVRPTDIIIVAMSKDFSDDDRGLVNSAWNTDLENASSSFWERNHYPKICRFISVPVTNEKNAFFKKMMFEYWMIVLTLATTDIPASSLQGYRIYECGVDIDKQELKDLMNSHVSRLRAMSESIRIKEEKLKKRNPNVFFEDDDSFSLDEEIKVVYPGAGPESILTSNLKPCIASDLPKKESDVWFSDKINAEKKMKVFLRNIKREVDVAGYQAHVNASLYVDEEHDIDRFHAEDIEEDRKSKEMKVICAETKKLIHISEVTKKMNDTERNVVKEMDKRINKKTVFISALTVALVVLAGFIPYIISIFKISPDSFGDGAIIISLTLFAVLLGGLLALLLLRNRLKRLIKKYNKEMIRFSRYIMSGAKIFSDYYSAVCTCMREKAVLDNSVNKQKRRVPMRKRLRANKAKIDNAIDISKKEWLYAYGIENNENLYYVYDEDTSFEKLDSEINLDTENISDEYLMVIDPENFERENYLPINDSEAIVKAPYGFITKLRIIRKNIFDKSEKKDERREEKCSN